MLWKKICRWRCCQWTSLGIMILLELWWWIGLMMLVESSCYVGGLEAKVYFWVYTFKIIGLLRSGKIFNKNVHFLPINETWETKESCFVSHKKYWWWQEKYECLSKSAWLIWVSDEEKTMHCSIYIYSFPSKFFPFLWATKTEDNESICLFSL